MTDALALAKKYFPVKEVEVPAEYKTIKNAMMNTTVDTYYIEGVGNMTFQKAKAMLGLMKMDMMCITPIDRDLPLFSYDVINAMGNYTLIIEIYDVMLDKTERIVAGLNDLEIIKADYADLPDNEVGEHWYDSIKLSSSVSKKGKKNDMEAKCQELYGKLLTAYFDLAKALPELEDKEAKRQASDAYVQGLLDNGGPSTDQFVKMIGLEKTTEYFKKVIFGTAR